MFVVFYMNFVYQNSMLAAVLHLRLTQ